MKKDSLEKIICPLEGELKLIGDVKHRIQMMQKPCGEIYYPGMLYECDLNKYKNCKYVKEYYNGNKL